MADNRYRWSLSLQWHRWRKLGKRMNASALFSNTYQMLLCQRYCIYNTKNWINHFLILCGKFSSVRSWGGFEPPPTPPWIRHWFRGYIRMSKYEPPTSKMTDIQGTQMVHTYIQTGLKLYRMPLHRWSITYMRRKVCVTATVFLQLPGKLRWCTIRMFTANCSSCGQNVCILVTTYQRENWVNHSTDY